ncbi:MAG: branched-chain amino acid ABC transporter permease [Verrucomicrobiota bacterium]
MSLETAINEQKQQPSKDDGMAPPWMVWGLAAVVTALLFAWSPGYISHLLVMLGIYLLLAYSLNFVTGFGGLIVFCHATFYGIGAYAYALTRLRAGAPGSQVTEMLWAGDWGYLPAVAAAGVAAAVLAGLIGWVSLRFRSDHFIFATLGFQMIVFVVLYNWVELARGPFGIYGIPRPEVFGWVVREPWQYVLLGGFFLLVILPWLFRLYRSPFGLALQTMREDERAARAMGVNTNALALRAMIVAGGVAGVAGALYAGYVTYIDPTSFSLRESIFLVTLLMLGGGGNVKGPLAGAVVMLALPEALRFVGLPDAVAANVREIIYGAMLAALMYWRPQGLAGTTLIRI